MEIRRDGSPFILAGLSWGRGRKMRSRANEQLNTNRKIRCQQQRSSTRRGTSRATHLSEAAGRTIDHNPTVRGATTSEWTERSHWQPCRTRRTATQPHDARRTATMREIGQRTRLVGPRQIKSRSSQCSQAARRPARISCTAPYQSSQTPARARVCVAGHGLCSQRGRRCDVASAGMRTSPACREKRVAS